MPSQTSKPLVEAAYLGPIASFSNQAALSYFGPNASLTPKLSFAEVFATVKSQSSSVQANDAATVVYGVVAVENSTNGSVVQTLDLLADRTSQFRELSVCGVLYLTVRHCLLVAKSPNKQADLDHRISKIRKLYTHPQVWGQCEAFLSKHLKGIGRLDTSSTSRAAEIVAEEGEEGGGAAIGSVLCAAAYGLDVLVEGIEDWRDNVTRFFILKKGGGPADGVVGVAKVREAAGEKWKTLISFTIEHTAPGALVKALMVFEKYGLNLTKIDSRPSLEQSWHYIFLVECEGRREGNGKGKVDSVLGDLESATQSCRYWGSFRDQFS